MNALTTPAQRANGALALLPTNMRDAMEIAAMMAKAGFFPKELQTPGSCLFVVEQAMRWNMSPYAVATEMSFPQGKPMFSGKLVAAAIQSSGTIQGRLHYAYSGQGADRAVTVSATLRGETEPVSVDVRLADAKTSNQHWIKSPDQMLAYHGARVWARRYAPEVMLGVYTPEEFDEAPTASPLPPARGPQIDAAADMAPPAAKPWDGMAWPICDRRGACVDLGDPDMWAEEIQRRVAHIQGLQTLEDAAKKKAVRQIADANREAWDALAGRGYEAAIQDVEALFVAALGEAAP